MLAKLYADSQALRTIQSTESKIARKRTLLPDYLPYIEGTLESPPREDPVLMTCMVWALDVEDYQLALRIGRFALQHGLSMPDRFQRNTATVLAEQIADMQLASAVKAGPVNGELLVEVATLVDRCDMPDQVRAKLFKALGIFYEAHDKSAALDCYTRAFDLDTKIGVKKPIEQLQRALAKEGAIP